MLSAFFYVNNIFLTIFSLFQIYFYMPSNATIDRNGKASMIMIPAKSYEQPSLAYIGTVSYTHLTLPTNREV